MQRLAAFISNSATTAASAAAATAATAATAAAAAEGWPTTTTDSLLAGKRHSKAQQRQRRTSKMPRGGTVKPGGAGGGAGGGLDSSAKLSGYLAFGCLSPRTVFAACKSEASVEWVMTHLQIRVRIKYSLLVRVCTLSLSRHYDSSRIGDGTHEYTNSELLLHVVFFQHIYTDNTILRAIHMGIETSSSSHTYPFFFFFTIGMC